MSRMILPRMPVGDTNQRGNECRNEVYLTRDDSLCGGKDGKIGRVVIEVHSRRGCAQSLPRTFKHHLRCENLVKPEQTRAKNKSLTRVNLLDAHNHLFLEVSFRSMVFLRTQARTCSWWSRPIQIKGPPTWTGCYSDGYICCQQIYS